MTITKASQKDIPAVMELEKSFPGTPWKNPSSFQKPDHSLFVSKSEGKTNGYILVHHKPDSNHIVKMMVDPNSRKSGIGKSLVNHVKSDTPLSLNVRASNTGAINFYNSIGFKKSAEHAGYYKNGESAHEMLMEDAAPTVAIGNGAMDNAPVVSKEQQKKIVTKGKLKSFKEFCEELDTESLQ
jgi:ribosomal-protein-alanine N-acetyltransferase